mgnify:CR=1 FL=1
MTDAQDRPAFDRRMLDGLICRTAGLAFPIRNGIPVMLIDEARRLE